MNLALKYVNLKELYNQDIKKQVTTKYFLKKKTCFTWNSQPQRHSVQKMFSVPYFSIRGVNFSNNISITQVRINERNTNLTRPLQPPNHELSPLHDLMISPHVKHSAIKLLKNICSLMQSFFLEKVPSNFWGVETLCVIFISFPIA